METAALCKPIQRFADLLRIPGTWVLTGLGQLLAALGSFPHFPQPLRLLHTHLYWRFLECQSIEVTLTQNGHLTHHEIPSVASLRPGGHFPRIGWPVSPEYATGGRIVPQAVRDQIVVMGAGRPASRIVAEQGWIRSRTLTDPSLAEQLPGRLHRGEREAIALAKELDAHLLVDDYQARREARSLGIDHFGSLRLLKEAKAGGLIDAVRPILDQLVSTGTYLSEGLYQVRLNPLFPVGRGNLNQLGSGKGGLRRPHGVNDFLVNIDPLHPKAGHLIQNSHGDAETSQGHLTV